MVCSLVLHPEGVGEELTHDPRGFSKWRRGWDLNPRGLEDQQLSWPKLFVDLEVQRPKYPESRNYWEVITRRIILSSVVSKAVAMKLRREFQDQQKLSIRQAVKAQSWQSHYQGFWPYCRLRTCPKYCANVHG
jgi:hypothetical protein